MTSADRPERPPAALTSFEQRMRDEIARCGGDLEVAVGLVIGAASACWDNLAGAGTFRDRHASALVTVLVEHIDAARPPAAAPAPPSAMVVRCPQP